jgi:hypothetical protein
MSIVLVGSTSGSCTLQEQAVAGTTVLTLPTTSGTVLTSTSPSSDLPSSINGPAFSAYATSNQTLASLTLTKIQFNTEEFDTASAYDNATNYRFTPLVAGYYQITMTAGVATTGSSVANTQLVCGIYKNGSIFKFGGQTLLNNTYDMLSTISTLIYLNGTTDYVEGYLRQISGGSLTTAAGQSVCYFQGVLVRGA